MMKAYRIKGKDISKVPTSKLPTDDTLGYVSIKYDGNYFRIVKNRNDTVQFFTSGGKEFYWGDVATLLMKEFKGISYILEGEYIGLTEGKLGDLGKCTLTTDRTLYAKNPHNILGDRHNILGDRKVKIFNAFGTNLDTPLARHTWLVAYDDSLKRCKLDVVTKLVVPYADASIMALEYISKGYEGIMWETIDADLPTPAKDIRTNHIIKMKVCNKATLTCIGVTAGEGKYLGKIGALVLEDSEGRLVNVGSGLSDEDRDKQPYDFIGKEVTIDYYILKDTYLQPRVKAIL